VIKLSSRQCVEQFHLLFLDHLGRKLDKNLYSLKGGCNLRFYFKSIRYSQNIDLDVQIIARDTLRNKVNKILSSSPLAQILKVKGIEISNISEPKQTDVTQRWKLVLNNSHGHIPLHTKIEFSRRTVITDAEFAPIDSELIHAYQLPPILANHYVAEKAYQKKVQALIGRNQTQARDVFDLFLLLSTTLSKPALKKITQAQLQEAQTNAMALTFQDFKGQVLIFLPPEYQSQYDSQDVWQDMLLQVCQALDWDRT